IAEDTKDVRVMLAWIGVNVFHHSGASRGSIGLPKLCSMDAIVHKKVKEIRTSRKAVCRHASRRCRLQVLYQCGACFCTVTFPQGHIDCKIELPAHDSKVLRACIVHTYPDVFHHLSTNLSSITLPNFQPMDTIVSDEIEIAVKNGRSTSRTRCRTRQ